jgi:predicted PurR-regulated permease PerM
MMIVLPLLFGLWGVFVAFPAADFFSTLVTGLWLWKDVRSLSAISPNRPRGKGREEAEKKAVPILGP